MHMHKCGTKGASKCDLHPGKWEITSVEASSRTN